MKKNLILMVLMFGILVGFSALISATCTDTDSGKDYPVKGSISYNGGLPIWDICYNSQKLEEKYCTQAGMGSTTTFSCLGGCSDGACVPPTYSCTDSDGGKDYQTKGEVTQTPGMTVSDLCHDSNLLIEGYCNVNQNFASQNYNCPNGCSNGACVSGGISGVGPAEASAGSVAKTGTTRTSSTGTKTKTSSSSAKARKSSVPRGWEVVKAADGTDCYVKKSGRTTGRFLGFMFRD